MRQKISKTEERKDGMERVKEDVFIALKSRNKKWKKQKRGKINNKIKIWTHRTQLFTSSDGGKSEKG